MRLIIDIPDNLIGLIRRVNPSTRVNDFIIVALENQLHLEEDKLADYSNNGPINGIKYNSKNIIRTKLPIQNSQEQNENTIKLLNNLKRDKIEFDVINPTALQFPIKNHFLWGQYNKLFPVKFVLRFLIYQQILNNNNSVPLNEFSLECANSAVEFKKILNTYDHQNKRKRGEEFSTGFPDDDDKSKKRFMNHFIGGRTALGEPLGASISLGFVEITNGRIGITSFGLNFAKLDNPNLDGNFSQKEVLSSEERQFLINHLKSHLPVEWSAVNKILTWITNAINTPDSLNNHIRSLNDKWSDKMVNTMRTGYLGRMFDLGFIYRVKNGVMVQYNLTEFGKKMEGTV